MTDVEKPSDSPVNRPRQLRYEGTPEAKAIWEAVDRAAERCPEWVKDRLDEICPGRVL